MTSAVIGRQLRENEVALKNIRTEYEKLFYDFLSIVTDELNTEEKVVVHLDSELKKIAARKNEMQKLAAWRRSRSPKETLQRNDAQMKPLRYDEHTTPPVRCLCCLCF